MKKSLIILGATFIVAIILIQIIPAIVNVYNTGVIKFNAVNIANSNLDIMYKKRDGLIDNITETVKGYSQFEKSTLEKVIAARYRASVTNAPADHETLSRLLLVFEQYPNLKSSEHFSDLRNELISLETEIQKYREQYNIAANDFNVYIKLFPNNIMASLVENWKVLPLYSITEAERKEVENPKKINFRTNE